MKTFLLLFSFLSIWGCYLDEPVLPDEISSPDREEDVGVDSSEEMDSRVASPEEVDSRVGSDTSDPRPLICPLTDSDNPSEFKPKVNHKLWVCGGDAQWYTLTFEEPLRIPEQGLNLSITLLIQRDIEDSEYSTQRYRFNLADEQDRDPTTVRSGIDVTSDLSGISEGTVTATFSPDSSDTLTSISFGIQSLENLENPKLLTFWWEWEELH